jgi:hypothetical protein
MTATMDRDTAELLLAEIEDLWPGLMADDERRAWLEALRPNHCSSLDAEQSAEVILGLKHDVGFATRRPRLSDFLEAYSECSAVEDDDSVTDPASGLAAVAELRERLVHR